MYGQPGEPHNLPLRRTLKSIISEREVFCCDCENIECSWLFIGMKLKAFLRKTTGGKHRDHRYFWWHSTPVLPCANLRCVHPSLCDTRELFSSRHGQNRHTICFLRHILKFWTLCYFFQVWLKKWLIILSKCLFKEMNMHHHWSILRTSFFLGGRMKQNETNPGL